MMKTIRGCVAAMALAALTLTSAPAAAQTRAPTERLTIPQRVAALRVQEQRLITIGERLAIAAAPWCQRAWTIGWTLGDLGQYPKTVRMTVRTEWGLPSATTVFVSAIAPGSAAASAGIVPGHAITAINGESPMRYTGDQASRHALANSERVIAEALTANDGRISISTLAPDGTRRTLDLAARAACASRFELSVDDEKQAYADGSVVQVTLGMAQFTSDEELAGVVAHELAHNMLRHRLRQDARGVPANYTRHLGRNARVVRGFEEEADRLSVWLLAQAGYDPSSPIAFWNRFGPDNDSPHPFGRLHDPWRVRVANLQDEITTMRAARGRNRAATPIALINAIREAEAAEAAGEREESGDEPAAGAASVPVPVPAPAEAPPS